MVSAPAKSCSSCRFRKIKCDRREKLKEANAADDSDVKCSNCQSSGTSCAFISAPVKPRLGKRIRALRDLEHDELLYPAASSSSSGTAKASSSSSNSQNQLVTSRNGSQSASSVPSTSALPLELWNPSAPVSSSATGPSTFGQILLRPGMFGIRGLTKQLLESCIAAYLFTISPTLPVIRVDSFLPRLRAFFKLYSGELPEPGIEPLDDLLVIACACSGASCLNSSGSEVVAGAERKFEIRADLMTSFIAMAESEGGERLKRAGLDGVAACYLVSIIKDDERDDVLGYRESIKENPSLKISPISTEGVVRLGIALGLHIRTPESIDQMKAGFVSRAAGSASPLEGEGPARNRIWWCILGNDAFRALAYRRPTYISEDSFDHGGDGKVQSVSAVNGLPNWIRFEFQWLSAMVTVTFLARSIVPRILSERAQRRGIVVEELSGVINGLEKWKNDLPQEITWEAQHQPGAHGTGEAVGERAFRCRLRALYLECLFHFSSLGVYYGLEDAGFRHFNDQIVETATYLPAIVNQPISTASVRAASSAASSPASSFSQPSNTPASDSRLYQTLKKVEALANTSFERIALLLPQAASAGMVRASPSVIRGVGTTAILWATEVVVRRAREGVGSEELTRTLDQTQNLISAVATCDSSQNTPLVVRQMQEAVTKARDTVQEVLNNRRESSASTSGTASTSNQTSQQHNDRTSAFNFSSGGDHFMSSSNPFHRSDQQPNFFFNSAPSQPSPNVNPSTLLPTADLGMEADQIPQWLAEFVSGSENQDPIFEFPTPDQEPSWLNGLQ